MRRGSLLIVQCHKIRSVLVSAQCQQLNKFEGIKSCLSLEIEKLTDNNNSCFQYFGDIVCTPLVFHKKQYYYKMLRKTIEKFNNFLL